MASGSSLDSALSRISKNHLECGICINRYKEPKILECLHSFCEECLKTYATGQHPNRPQIPCPLCRQETTLPREGVSGLKSSFHITSLMEDITLQEKIADSTDKLMCDICDKTKEATHRCFDCPKNLCGACVQTHQSFHDLEGHTIATFKDIQQGKVEHKNRRGIPRCEKHRGEVKQFFCEKCQVLICRDCTVVDHPSNKGHCVVDASTAAHKLKHSLKENLNVVVEKTKALQVCEKKALQNQNIFGQNAQKMLKEVQTKAEELRSNVTREEIRLVQKIQSFQDERQKTIDDFRKDVNARIKRNQHSAEIAQDITTKATDSDFLSLYPEVNKDLETLGTSGNIPELDNIEVQWDINSYPNTDLGDVVIRSTSWQHGSPPWVSWPQGSIRMVKRTHKTGFRP